MDDSLQRAFENAPTSSGAIILKCWIVKATFHDRARIEMKFKDRLRVFFKQSKAIEFAQNLGYPMKDCSDTPGVMTVYAAGYESFEIYCTEIVL